MRKDIRNISINNLQNLPDTKQLKKELEREKYKRKYAKTIKDTVFTLITVAAVTILIAFFLFPILHMYGTSMAPALSDGDIVVSVKGNNFSKGDIIAFYYNNKILVKRVIASPGEWVNIDKDGNVFVNGELLDEPYLSEKSLGTCDIEMPYQVPESRLFVIGDNRSTSMDSRSTAIGCVTTEQIVGKVTLRVWPLNQIGFVN